jgi:hypothetical protein
MIPDTQRESYNKLLENVWPKRLAVFLAIKRLNGATSFELVKDLDWKINCVSGRITELNESNIIKDSGLRRINPETGRNAIVWVEHETGK